MEMTVYYGKLFLAFGWRKENSRYYPMPIYPTKIRLEASTACQLKCPSCPTATGEIAKSIGAGFLKFDDFKALIDLNPRVREIELSNWGEIFLNPEITKIMEYAFSKNVALRCDTGANFNTVSDEALEALVKNRFRSITCSIDGASQETYGIYRRNGNFEQVLKNIRKLNEIKKKYNCKWPQLRWQFVVFGHNEHEIIKARKMAGDLGMRFWVKLSWGAMYTKKDFSPVKDRKLVQQESGLGVADRDEYRKRYGQDYAQKIVCAQMWAEPQVNFDGKILGCCINYWGDYGNAFKDKISDFFNTEKMEYARAMLKGKKQARADIPCSSCTHYRSMKGAMNWVTGRDIIISRFIYKFRYWLQDNRYQFFLLQVLSVFKSR
jgi:MoaA/NifB/PqqE/SkfB family radical SAM enzyme